MKLHKYTESQLRTAVQQSRSIRESLKHLNVSSYGGNYQVFKKAIKYFQIDTSHFLGQGANRDRIFGPKQPLEKYLSNELSTLSHRLKTRLIKAGLKLHQCEDCKLTKWRGQKIPIELHHINGIHNDNSLENLKILCPNCHALTETYRGRNIKA